MLNPQCQDSDGLMIFIAALCMLLSVLVELTVSLTLSFYIYYVKILHSFIKKEEATLIFYKQGTKGKKLVGLKN